MENGPLVLKVAKTVEEMAIGMAAAIKYLDTHIFGETLPVTISDNPAFTKMGPAGFLPKRWIFKLFGMKDEYMIFTKSSAAKEARVRPFSIIGISLHEVRHRYQKKNPNCLISPNLTRDNPLLFDQKIVDIAIERGRKYRDYKMQSCEFDAAMVEWVFNLHCNNKSMSHEVILKLITCDEASILKIISDLKYS